MTLSNRSQRTCSKAHQMVNIIQTDVLFFNVIMLQNKLIYQWRHQYFKHPYRENRLKTVSLIIQLVHPSVTDNSEVCNSLERLKQKHETAFNSESKLHIQVAIPWLQLFHACHASKSTLQPPLIQDQDYPDFQHQNDLPLSHEEHRYKTED